jgi:hypothetical protein
MGHLQTVEQELRKVLQTGSAEEVVRFVKEAVLASYKNGLAARVQQAGAEEAPKREGWRPRKDGGRKA